MDSAPLPEIAPALDAESFEQLRPLLFGIAYRMLGSVSDAEDLVQDTYLRYARAVEGGTRIDSLKAYLAATITRLSIDHLKSARIRREQYVGLWLPEPLLTDRDFVDAPDVDAESDSLDTAFLVLLEKLKPVERAVFLLHDVFGFPHDRVGEMVGKTKENTRKIASRAREAVLAERRPRHAARGELEELAMRFFAAMRLGDVEGLVAVLAPSVVVYGDGGGKAPQWTRPIVGVADVSRLLAGLGRQVAEHGGTIELREINGMPGAVVMTGGREVVSTFSLDIGDDGVRALRSVINPEKLGHIGPVADVRALLRARPG